MYMRTAWLFSYWMVLSLKPDILFLIRWRFLIWSCLCWCRLLVQNLLFLDIALLHLCDRNSEPKTSWKNMMWNVANLYWILNLWPGGLLWNTNSWIRSRREMREKCSLMAWKCDDACVIHCCLYPLCPIYKLFSLE